MEVCKHDLLLSIRPADRAVEAHDGWVVKKHCSFSAWILLCGMMLCAPSVLVGHGDRDEHIRLLDEKIVQSPDCTSLLLERASHLRQHGERALAQKDVEQVLKQAPGNVNALVLQCLLKMDEGAWDQALRTANQICETEPGVSRGFELRSRIHQERGAADAAAQDARQVAVLNPSVDLRWYIRQATLWMQADHAEAALQALEQAARRYEGNPAIEESRLKVWMAMENRDEARKSLIRLHQDFPALSLQWWMMEADMWAAQGEDALEQQALDGAIRTIAGFSARKKNSIPVLEIQHQIQLMVFLDNFSRNTFLIF